MLHEERNQMSEKTQNMKRAIDSLREEFEAVDWYNQRADAATDPDLQKILLHNAKEEKEHAMMILEWMRRNDDELDDMMREFLFTTKDIVGHEEEAQEEGRI